jgi:hypothetical protein
MHANWKKPMWRRCWSCAPENSFRPCWVTRARNDPRRAAGTGPKGIQGQHGQTVPVVRDATPYAVLPHHQGGASRAGTPGSADQGHD